MRWRLLAIRTSPLVGAPHPSGPQAVRLSRALLLARLISDLRYLVFVPLYLSFVPLFSAGFGPA